MGVVSLEPHHALGGLRACHTIVVDEATITRSQAESGNALLSRLRLVLPLIQPLGRCNGAIGIYTTRTDFHFSRIMEIKLNDERLE